MTSTADSKINLEISPSPTELNTYEVKQNLETSESFFKHRYVN